MWIKMVSLIWLIPLDQRSRLAAILGQRSEGREFYGVKGGQDIFRGQDPQKNIGFDHFVQENVNFFLISLKVGGKLEGQDILQWGNCPPKPPRGYATAAA